MEQQAEILDIDNGEAGSVDWKGEVDARRKKQKAASTVQIMCGGGGGGGVVEL